MNGPTLLCRTAFGLSLPLIVVGLAGCGNAKDGGVGTQDASAPSYDAGGPDARAEASSLDQETPDVAASDGAVGLRGTQLVASDQVTAEGVTTDGYAIYLDTLSDTLNAIPLTGGAPIPMGAAGTSSFPFVLGEAVSFWTNDFMTLTLWTAAHGAQTLSTATAPIFPAVSADGKHVLYIDGVTAIGSPGNIMVAATDGTGKTLLASSVQVSNSACYPYLGFAGASAVAAYCTGDGDAGVGNLSAWSGPSWTVSTLASDVVPFFLTNGAGTTLLASGSSGLLAVPVAGGSPTLIDPAGANAFVFVNNDQDVLYATGQALKRASVTSPQPTTLGSAGLSIVAVSPDQTWILTDTMENIQTFATDLYLISTTPPGSQTTLAPTMTSNIGGDVFTQDSAYVAYLTNYGEGGTGLTGTLNILPVNGGVPRTVSMTAFLAAETSGSKIIFNDNYSPRQPGYGLADIAWLDASQTASPTVLVQSADAEFFITAARDKILYSWSYSAGPQAGLWVMPAP